MNRSIFGPRWRPAMVALSALLVVAILFTIAPVRDAAADFLSLFRIRKFAVIPLNQQQMDRLANLATTTRDAFGEPQILREPGPIQTVASGEQASALAGYRVRAVSRLPDGASIDRFFVEAGPLMQFEINRAAAELALQAAGLTTTGLPQAEKIVFDVDVASMVTQEYNLRKGEGAGFNRLTFVQVPSPQVNLPDGIDPVALAETSFMFLGMPQEDAQRLANSIDWTSTLVVPLPAESAQAREVTVDGVTGLLLLDVDNGRKDNALLWEKDGILHFMAAGNTDEKLLLDLANSLQ